MLKCKTNIKITARFHKKFSLKKYKSKELIIVILNNKNKKLSKYSNNSRIFNLKKI